MAYAEKRGNLWRARWRGPDGTLESKPGFQRRKDAEDYARDQEAAIRNNTYVDPRAGRITLTEWVNQWYPALDLEPTTLSNYRYRIEVLILPKLGNRALNDLNTEQIATWEMDLVQEGYARRTAQDARSTLITILSDAVPRYIRANPAARRRGKGRKGQRRIERLERTEKAWPTPLQALLIAERCAALSGCETDFVMILTVAYTGMRWSEAIGLTPGSIGSDVIQINWKLYELDGRFYKGRPKSGSIRPADLPPFLAQLIAGHLANTPDLGCTCRATEEPWCPGAEYAFLGPGHGHFRRSNYSERFFRPAADGRYPAREGKHRPRPAMPVLVKDCEVFPGQPVPPWPVAIPGQEFVPPTGRGFPRYVSDQGTGRCAICGHAWPRRLDGKLTSHMAGKVRCPGSAQGPAADVTLATWLPVLHGLTPHGLRHGHQTWMDEEGIPEVLKTERMGHEMPGMQGVYGHVSPAMRADLKAALQERWEASLLVRAQLSSRSIVPALDRLLATQREAAAKVRHLTPRTSPNRKRAR
jgi:integrase